MESGIYKITNTQNGRSYIGLSKDINKRRNQHLQGIKDFGTQKQLYNAIQDWGFENFTFDILEHCHPSKLGEREVYYIKLYDSYKNGYNASVGGEGSGNKFIKDKYNLGININIVFSQKFVNITNTNNINKNFSHKTNENYQKFIEKANKKLLKYKNNIEKTKLIQEEIKNFENIKKNQEEKYQKLLEIIFSNTNDLKIIFNKLRKHISVNNIYKIDNINSFNIKTYKIYIDRFQRDYVKYKTLVPEIIDDVLKFEWRKLKTEHSKINIQWDKINSIYVIIKDLNNVEINFNNFKRIANQTFVSDDPKSKIEKDKMIIYTSLIDSLLILSKIQSYTGIEKYMIN